MGGVFGATAKVNLLLQRVSPQICLYNKNFAAETLELWQAPPAVLTYLACRGEKYGRRDSALTSRVRCYASVTSMDRMRAIHLTFLRQRERRRNAFIPAGFKTYKTVLAPVIKDIFCYVCDCRRFYSTVILCE